MVVAGRKDVTSHGSGWRADVVTSYDSGWRKDVITNYGTVVGERMS